MDDSASTSAAVLPMMMMGSDAGKSRACRKVGVASSAKTLNLWISIAILVAALPVVVLSQSIRGFFFVYYFFKVERIFGKVSGHLLSTKNDENSKTYFLN